MRSATVDRTGGDMYQPTSRRACPPDNAPVAAIASLPVVLGIRLALERPSKEEGAFLRHKPAAGRDLDAAEPHPTRVPSSANSIEDTR